MMISELGLSCFNDAEGENMIGAAPEVEWQKQRGKAVRNLQCRGVDNGGGNWRVFLRQKKIQNVYVSLCNVSN